MTSRAAILSSAHKQRAFRRDLSDRYLCRHRGLARRQRQIGGSLRDRRHHFLPMPTVIKLLSRVWLAQLAFAVLRSAAGHRLEEK
jgi:hypothetical protein